MMNTSATGAEPDLLSHHNMNDGTGSSTATEGVNNINGTLTNMDPNSDWVEGVLASSGGSGNSVTLTVTDNNGQCFNL